MVVAGYLVLLEPQTLERTWNLILGGSQMRLREI
jgi:hypothetical protein